MSESMNGSVPAGEYYDELQATAIDVRAVMIQNHWAPDGGQQRVEQDLFQRDPNAYVNDLHVVLQHSIENKRYFEDMAVKYRKERVEIAQQRDLLVAERATAQQAIDRLLAIRDVLDQIVQHQGRNCAARDICGDHDRITTLAKVACDYLGEL